MSQLKLVVDPCFKVTLVIAPFLYSQNEPATKLLPSKETLDRLIINPELIIGGTEK